MNTCILSVARSKGAATGVPFLLMIIAAVAVVVVCHMFFTSSDPGRVLDNQNEQAASSQLNTSIANPWSKVPDNFVPAEPIPPSPVKENTAENSVNDAAKSSAGPSVHENLSAYTCAEMLKAMRSESILVNDVLYVSPIDPETLVKLCDHDINTITVIPKGQISPNRTIQ